jgi:Ca2+-binding EF-hand superfamily protein
VPASRAFFGLLALATVLSSPAAAQEPRGGLDAKIEAKFSRYDRRGDGKLTPDEAPEGLRAEFRVWDENGDGFIELSEFRAYTLARMQWKRQDRGTVPPPVPPAAPAASPGVKHPSLGSARQSNGMPTWFARLDLDGDGQVDLFEWRKGGRPVAEFEEMDRNGDGVLSAEEVLRYARLHGGPDVTMP